jgi:predicted MFS family arabinose efflux permease
VTVGSLPHGLRALNHPDFRHFFLSQFAAQVGSWMQNVAQAWLVLQLTNSPFRLGLLATLQFSPVLLFSIVSGAVADRLPKRRLLIATQTTLACQGLLLALLVATGHVEYWHVALLGLALGFANVVDQPARQSFLIQMVGRADVSSAVALNSAGFNLARIIGPAIAGVVIGRLGVAPTFLVNGLGFTGVIITLLRMKVPDPRPGPARTSIFEEIAEGVRYAAGTPRLRLAIGLVFVVSLCVFNFSVYVPLLAKNVLGLGAEGFGFLMASLGVGAVGGALTVGARAARFPSVRSMLVAATLALGMLTGLGFTRRIELAVPLLFLTGYWGIMLMASCNTSIQLQAPDALRGRVMSIYTWVSGGVFPIGAFIVGSISEAWGVSTAFLFNGTLGLAAVGALGLWWQYRRG